MFQINQILLAGHISELGFREYSPDSEESRVYKGKKKKLYPDGPGG